LSGRRFLWLWIGLVVAGWSANYVAGKIALREFPAGVLSPLRLCVAAAAMVPFYVWERRWKRETWDIAELPTLLVAGVIGAAGTQLLWVFGISRTSVAHGVIFSNLAPLLVLLLAAARGLERITAAKLGGLALALAGVAALKWFEPTAPAGVESAWAGDLICFGGSVTFALFNVFGKSATKSYSGTTITAFGYAGGAILAAPLLIARGAGFAFSHVSWLGWACALYMSLVSSVLCYLIYYRVLAQLEPSRATAFGYLQPPVATLFGALLLAEPVTPALLFPGLVILAGLFLAERGR
jgi:drug/metabolite transporter (DMT)-like permease